MPRKARRRAWGSVTEAARGKKYVLRWVENTPSGRKRRSRTIYGTYREACNELAKIQATKCDERAVPTIGSLFEARYLPWLERRYEDSASNTKSLYLRAWKNHCEPKWARVPIDQVKPLDVQEWLDGMAHGNAHSALIVMRRALDFAVNLEQIPSNPFRRDYEMPAKGSARSKEVYGLAQAAEMLAKVEGMPYEAAYILAAFGGCRTGESLGVRVEDVREIRAGGVRFAAVAVKRQAGHRNGEIRDGTKTAQSERETLVPEPYCSILLKLRDEREADGLEWMSEAGGRPIGTGTLGYLWRKVGDIPFANLRNSWRTFAQYEWGVGYSTLELLMGHKIPGVTGQRYLRPSTEQLAEDFAASYVKE